MEIHTVVVERCGLTSSECFCSGEDRCQMNWSSMSFGVAPYDCICAEYRMGESLRCWVEVERGWPNGWAGSSGWDGRVCTPKVVSPRASQDAHRTRSWRPCLACAPSCKRIAAAP